MDFTFRRCNTLKVCSGRQLSKTDWISGLPDVILVCVLSFLTMKEAGRTSLLSKRWRHVWAYVPLLNFDDSRILDELEHDYESLTVKRNKYLRWVDQVVSSHKAPTVDEFRLRFDLDESGRDIIDKGVRFSAEKRVKRLELHFGAFQEFCNHFPYNFPSLSFCNLLTSLKLAYVNVTGEVLERLIYNCKALEFLSVTESKVLTDLKVVGPSLKLKSLRIHECDLINMEISAPNLVSVDYSGPNLSMPFKSTPKLAELSILGPINPYLMMSFINHQIKVLKLNIADIQITPFTKVFPKCTRLEMLDVQFDPEWYEDLFRLSSLIKACPLLHKLVIQLDLSSLRSGGWKMEGEEPWCHYHLKILEIVGFAGSASGFARYLIKKAVSLEKLIIDPQPPFLFRTPGEHVVDETILRARKKAKLLRKNLKHGTELEIR